MCGLVGAASSTVMGIRGGKYITQALYVDQLRGEDSTGLALVNKDNEVDIYKRALAASDFLCTRIGKKAIDAVEKSFVVIGHNRATTIGSTTNETAHPFAFGNVVGAHNGTISSHRGIFSVTKHSVDSMNLFASMDADGDYIKTLSGIHTGAYAITMYDIEQQCMVFARNDERPLSIIVVEDGILWGSEASMLYWLASRNGLLTKDTEFIDVDPATLYTYCCNEMKFISKKKYTHKSPPVYGGGFYQGKGGSGGAGGSYYNTDRSLPSLRGGTQMGVKYDMSLTTDEVQAAMLMDTHHVPCILVDFVPYNNYLNTKDIPDDATGKAVGYIYEEESECLFPALFFGHKYGEFRNAHEDALACVGNVMTGYFTKEGNVVCFVVNLVRKEKDGPLLKYEEGDENALNAFDENFLPVWQNPDTKLGLSYNLIMNKFMETSEARVREIAQMAAEGKKPSFLDKSADKSKGKEKDPPKKDEKVVPIKTAKDKAEEVLRLTARELPGPDGEMSVEEFMEKVECGCSVCKGDIYVEDAWEMAWDTAHGDVKPICPTCTNNMFKALSFRAEKEHNVVIMRPYKKVAN